MQDYIIEVQLVIIAIQMQVDIVMDRRISYEVFVVRCLGCIISSRLNPFSEQNLQKHLNPLTEKVKHRKEQFDPILLEVYIKTQNNKEKLKVQEWSFFPTSILEESLQSASSHATSKNSSNLKNKTKNVFGCKLPQKIYSQLGKYKLEFNLIIHTQAVTPLEGENVFQAPIQYFEFEQFNSTLSLVYNYDFDAIEEEDEFYIITPSTPPNNETSFRKYSEGLQQIEAFTFKTQTINKDTIKEIKQKASKLKFESMKGQTIQSTLHYLGLN